MKKNDETGNSLNAVERELVPTRVLNPNASEVSYKPKQRSYRKTNLKKKVLQPDINSPGAQMSSAETYPTPYSSLLYGSLSYFSIELIFNYLKYGIFIFY